jgi:hypothetical protein
MAATSVVNMSYPKTRESYEKFIKIVRTDTTAFVGAKLPKDAVITGLYVIGHAASDAATTAVVSIGSTSSANEYLASFDVKTAATGEGYNPAGAAAVGTAMCAKLTGDVDVYAKYAETGTASTTGGPWFVKIEYSVVGGGEDIQM